MTDYIPAAFEYFTNNQAGNNYFNMPSNTTFILGEPAVIDDAGAATIWHNTQYTNVYNALLNSYSKLKTPNAMTWTVNRDIDLGNCQFTKTLSPLITGQKISDNLCPTNTNTYWTNVCHW